MQVPSQPQSKSLVHTIDPPALGKPNPIYAAMTAAPLSPSTTMYTISGQVAESPSDGSIPPTLPEQIDLCLRRVDICLSHIGARKADMMQFMYYFRQKALEDYDAENGEGKALGLVIEKVVPWLEGHRPASCYSRTFGMTDDRYHCEFEAMVVLADEAKS